MAAEVLHGIVFGVIGISMTVDLIEKTATGLNNLSKWIAGDHYILSSFEALTSTRKFWLNYNLANLISSGTLKKYHSLNKKSITLFKEIFQHKETISKTDISGINARIDNSKKINFENLKRTVDIPLEQIKLTLLVKFTLTDMNTIETIQKLFYPHNNSKHKHKSFLYKLKVKEWERKNKVGWDIACKTYKKNKYSKNDNIKQYYYENHYTSWEFFTTGAKKVYRKEKMKTCSGHYFTKYYGEKHYGCKTPFEMPVEIYIIPKKDGVDELSGYYFQTNKPIFTGGDLTNEVTTHTLKKLIEAFTMIPIKFKKTTEIIDKLKIQLPDSSEKLDNIKENIDPFTTIYE